MRFVWGGPSVRDSNSGRVSSECGGRRTWSLQSYSPASHKGDSCDQCAEHSRTSSQDWSCPPILSLRRSSPRTEYSDLILSASLYCPARPPRGLQIRLVRNKNSSLLTTLEDSFIRWDSCYENLINTSFLILLSRFGQTDNYLRNYSLPCQMANAAIVMACRRGPSNNSSRWLIFETQHAVLYRGHVVGSHRKDTHLSFNKAPI